jgi:hypothetical protein
MNMNMTKHEHMKTNQVAASSKSMSTPLPVRALVPWFKFLKLLVRGFGKILWELRVKLAGVDEQRRIALLEICLQRVVRKYATASLNDAHRGPRA